jgi:hypothetical protein
VLAAALVAVDVTGVTGATDFLVFFFIGFKVSITVHLFPRW